MLQYAHVISTLVQIFISPIDSIVEMSIFSRKHGDNNGIEEKSVVKKSANLAQPIWR